MDTAKRKHSLFFGLSLACSMVSSLSLLAAVFVNNEGKNREILIAFGLLFWIGLILEQIFLRKANRLMKVALIKSKRPICGRSGIISPPTYPEGLVVDVVFIFSFVALLICIVFGLGEALMQYIFICFMVLSFRLHCFLDGRNYKYKKSKKRKVERKNG